MSTLKDEKVITNTRCSVCCDYPVRTGAATDAQAAVPAVEVYPLTGKAKDVPVEWYSVLLVEDATGRKG